MSRINYDTDVLKHFVRADGWLAACQYRDRRVRKAIRDNRRLQPLTYFTFCASSAIDFMLERAKVLKRDKKSGRLENVYFCEADDLEFQKIVNLIGGAAEAGFMERFENFVLCEDDHITEDRHQLDPADKVPDEASICQRFAYKALHKRFLKLFPFDVINLDLY